MKTLCSWQSDRDTAGQQLMCLGSPDHGTPHGPFLDLSALYKEMRQTMTDIYVAEFDLDAKIEEALAVGQ